MQRILLVKTSSLGDVVHNLPVVSDIALAMPGVQIDWVVEEAFAAIPALHPNVQRVIAVGTRRWRAKMHQRGTWREAKAFLRELRAERYHAVIDTQGLFKSAIVTSMAYGRRFGLGWRASREPLFPFYDQTFEIPRTLHAVERNRSLAGCALAYSPPDRIDYGIRAAASDFTWLGNRAYAVLIHATSARTKLWPEGRWTALGNALAEQGLRCVLPWGSSEERLRSERLAASIPNAVAPPRLTLAAAASLLGSARCAVGVDTGLTHLSGALGTATIGIYLSTRPAATGLHGCARAASVGGIRGSPSADDVLHALARVRA